ncbi:protein amnionless [Ostrinia furnacalis]|uniref:protein amnionless n=1 Tax=Ostrinia furnacalis TaxID=93504 RepID=UPI00103A7F57|nr:protein amnionless [Ostrinia furnacalis]
MWFKTALILLFCNIVCITFADKVTWLPNRSMNLPGSYNDKKLPCSKQTVVFPESIQESVKIYAGFAASEIILPSDGEIIFEDGEIILGADPEDTNCDIGKKYAYYEEDSKGSWNQPEAWSSSKFNKATPDGERIPCVDDVVVFPPTSQFTIQLPNVSQFVKEVNIDGVKFTTSDLRDRIIGQSDENQQFLFGSTGDVSVFVDAKTCTASYGCPCQENTLDINCALKYCPAPQCSRPIKPVGHCCEICGGSLIFDVSDNFVMEKFKSFVRSTIGSGIDKVDYHIGMLPFNNPREGTSTTKKRIQVIVVEKGEYTGTSLEMVNEIGYQLSNDWVREEKTLYLSGTPVSEAGMGGKIAVSMFFVVVFALGALYVYYYRPSEFRMPDLRSGLARGLVSRLNRRTDSVVSLTRRDSNVSGISGRAFRNPLYSSMRERVQLAESPIEE